MSPVHDQHAPANPQLIAAMRPATTLRRCPASVAGPGRTALEAPSPGLQPGFAA